MVTIDVPACMALGSYAAIKGRSRFRALGVCLFGFTPLAHLFELYFHDWEWQYISPTLPAWTSMVFVVGMNAAGMAAYEVARRMRRRQQWYLFGGINAAVAVYCLRFSHRVLWVGTYAEWAAGQGTLLPLHQPFMLLLAGTGTYLAVSTYFWLLRKPGA